ncbi:hypothetical protein [Methylobacterium sp. SI9]|uniref:hypothetical protein n=1 Tax=Methylobacterium guangdongense TaxID=3138811 RepID=UPI00313C2713
MDSTFWAGIVIGTIFSFVTNIIAQRTDFFFVKILERLKLRSTERRAARQRLQDKLARNLLDNPGLSSAYFALRMATATLFTLGGMLGAVMMSMTWAATETMRQVDELGIKPSEARINMISSDSLLLKISILLCYGIILIGGWTYLRSVGRFIRMIRLSNAGSTAVATGANSH